MNNRYPMPVIAAHNAAQDRTALEKRFLEYLSSRAALVCIVIAVWVAAAAPLQG